jgi:hypothetical protein
MAVLVYVYYCPANKCSLRKIESTISTEDAEKLTIEHVALAHPEYDPEWYITSPDGLKYEGETYVSRRGTS